MKILANYELKEMGQPIKETSCWLFFEKGKIAKHTISRFHYKSEIDKFRKELNFAFFKKYSLPLNETIN
jgi:hypothetical protein|tara:strand:+ start:208 stop:414 length:207 start_codon:yes stop_codon:yes gene_type:complete